MKEDWTCWKKFSKVIQGLNSLATYLQIYNYTPIEICLSWIILPYFSLQNCCHFFALFHCIFVKRLHCHLLSRIITSKFYYSIDSCQLSFWISHFTFFWYFLSILNWSMWHQDSLIRLLQKKHSIWPESLKNSNNGNFWPLKNLSSSHKTEETSVAKIDKLRQQKKMLYFRTRWSASMNLVKESLYSFSMNIFS